MKRSKKDLEEKERLIEWKEERLHPATKKSVLAILFFGIAVVLSLAAFEKAGPVGALLYNAFNSLFGLGYYLIPAVLVLITVIFLTSDRHRIVGISLIGGGVFILAGLGIMDLVLPGRAGLTGNIISLIEQPFGYPASFTILSSVLCASLLAIVNLPINLKNIIIRKKREEDREEEKTPLVKIAGESPKEPEKREEKKQEDEKKEKSEKNDSRDSEEETITVKGKAPVFKNYVPPPLSLLKTSTEKPSAGDLRANANSIKRTLESFGIATEMGEVSIGPKVSRYTLKPAEGVKLSRITALNQDLALALAAHPIRIEAPIPGKSLVGIEVPNKTAAIVRIGNLMAYPEFINSGPLSFVAGRDVSGDPIFADITKMPHMLIAGSTGSGKSVTIHSLIVSLLYKNSPETLKFIMIDPKKVELSTYQSLPHLICPVVIEGKKAVGVLRWAISEMERRYDLLLKAGNRDIKTYNQSHNPPLHYIVMIIDELADLMASYGREIEGSIVRLAQMARATGIHLIVSTQRPSVEVITGLIKANITARIALQVASQIDSRTILDMAGAEKLLGGGDMLFTSSAFSKPRRIQGSYITEEEIQGVADFIVENNQPISGETETIANTIQNSPSAPPLDLENLPDDGESDDLLDEAIGVVKEAQKASASLLQRRLKVGYARAARLLDIMESKGIIGPGEGAKPREVFIEADTSPIGGHEEISNPPSFIQ